eukprot:1160941-Pelagomonas_calceolata.AAC.3
MEALVQPRQYPFYDSTTEVCGLTSYEELLHYLCQKAFSQDTWLTKRVLLCSTDQILHVPASLSFRNKGKQTKQHTHTQAHTHTHMHTYTHTITQEAPSSGSVRAMRGVPLLSERWLPRKDTWLMQLTPEAVSLWTIVCTWLKFVFCGFFVARYCAQLTPEALSSYHASWKCGEGKDYGVCRRKA